MDTLYQSEQFKHGERRETETVSASVSGLFLNYIYIHTWIYMYIYTVYIYIYQMCLSEPLLSPFWPRASACVVLSSCWRHETLYKTQSQRHYWDVDWLLALYLHHFWCFYSCVPPVFYVFLSLFWPFNSPRFILSACACEYVSGGNVMERMSWEKESTFLIILCNLCVCLCVLSIMVGF